MGKSSGKTTLNWVITWKLKWLHSAWLPLLLLHAGPG